VLLDTEILIGWKNHFANLAKESDRMDSDHGYLDTVDIEYKHIIKICQHDFIHETVSKEELDKAVDKLNRGKSSGWINSELYDGFNNLR
jgi:CRISPR/Cas system-associated endonuclease/helicase Cas3